MRRFAKMKFEKVLSILIVVVFGAVAMSFNGSRLAYFGPHPLNQLTDTGTIPATSPVYAQNRVPLGAGSVHRAIWTPVAFGADDALSLNDFGNQMYAKTFAPSPITNRKSQMTEGSANLPHWVHVVARHPDGTIFLDEWGHNLRTNAGINWQYNQMAGTTAAACTYIALSNSGATPAATDTALASEVTSNGLARALATPTHTSNATSYTLAYTFTATGTQAVQNAGVLNASSGGTMCFENTFTQASLVTNDTLSVTWTITF